MYRVSIPNAIEEDGEDDASDEGDQGEERGKDEDNEEGGLLQSPQRNLNELDLKLGATANDP